jgi:hypothetical protein
VPCCKPLQFYLSIIGLVIGYALYRRVEDCACFAKLQQQDGVNAHARGPVWTRPSSVRKSSCTLCSEAVMHAHDDGLQPGYMSVNAG